MGFSENLRRLRETKGWTQKKLANRADIEQSHLSQIERETIAHPHMDTITALFDALNVNYDRLVKRLLEEVDPEVFLKHCRTEQGVSVDGAQGVKR